MDIISLPACCLSTPPKTATCQRAQPLKHPARPNKSRNQNPQQRRADPPDGQRALVNDRVQRVRLAPLRVGVAPLRGARGVGLPSQMPHFATRFALTSASMGEVNFSRPVCKFLLIFCLAFYLELEPTFERFCQTVPQPAYVAFRN